MQIYPIDLSDPIDQFHGSNTEAGATCQRHLSVSIGWLKELTIIPREIETVSQSTLKHMVKKTKGYIIKVDKGHFLIDLLRNAVTQFKSADPCLALAQARRRPGSPQVLLGPRPAWSTRHQTLCHCLPKSPQTRCPAAAVLCQRLASRHTPFRGFQNVREARPITTQNPSVGLYRFATAFPGHRKHVALERQSFASAWPGRHTPFRGFQNVRDARPITTQNPSVGLYRFANAFPGHREHVALQRQPFASAWPGRHTPFRGFQNVRDARPIATQNPSVGLYRFANAFPGHREHVALQRQPFASAWPCRHTPFRGFQNVREARPITTQNPSVGLYRFATAFPGHRKHVALQRQPFASTWPCRHTPFRGFQNVGEARPITTQNPSVGLYRFASAQHVAPQRQSFASAWPCRHTPFRGFQNVREARPITTQNPSVGLYRFATAFPGHREHVALQRQPCASAWPVAILHLEGFKTCAKHGPSRHKTPLWAFTALPLPSQVTANTLPCSGSPLPAPGLSPYSI